MIRFVKGKTETTMSRSMFKTRNLYVHIFTYNRARVVKPDLVVLDCPGSKYYNNLLEL